MFLGHIKTNLSQQSSKRVTEEMCSWEDSNSKFDEKKNTILNLETNFLVRSLNVVVLPMKTIKSSKTICQEKFIAVLFLKF